MNLKNFGWQRWTLIGVTAAFVIAGVVMHLVQPAISYAFAEAIAAVTAGVFGTFGYLVGKKKGSENK